MKSILLLILISILISIKAECEFLRHFYANKNCTLKQEEYTKKFNSDNPTVSGKCYDVRHDPSY